MNSEDVHHDTTANEQREPSVSSPGAMLRQAREQQGLSQQDIADKIFVKVNTVDSIENDKIDQTMSVTFTKGYVRNYAKHLGLDADRVISAFESTHTNPESPARLQSFSQKVAKQAHDDRWMMVTYGILFLLIAGVVIWWYQQDDSVVDDTATTAGETIESSERASAVTASPRTDAEPNVAKSQPQSLSQTRQDNEAEESPVQTQSAAQPSTNARATTGDQEQAGSLRADTAQERVAEDDDSPSDVAQVGDASAEQTANEASQAMASADTAKMTFTFGEDCWVNIEDANGETIATGIKREGRVMSVSGQPPISVTLGAPDNVAVTLNGTSVDISDYQNGRTARFTLPLQE